MRLWKGVFGLFSRGEACNDTFNSRSHLLGQSWRSVYDKIMASFRPGLRAVVLEVVFLRHWARIVRDSMFFSIRIRYLSALLGIVVIKAFCAASPAELTSRLGSNGAAFCECIFFKVGWLIARASMSGSLLDLGTGFAEDHEKCCLGGWLFNVFDLIAGKARHISYLGSS